MNQETKIQNAQMLALSDAGCLVFRNETAGCWVGKVIHKDAQTITLKDYRMIKAGLCEGSSDIIGIAPVTITEDMVGQTLGVFLADEVKTPKGRPTKEQLRFIEAVQNAGGIAGIARSVEEALELIRRG